ncbi:MAG: glycosyltransferase family 39 protein [Phycisphaerales bacterium]|nr:glycosyltransferase family 39 protein [Phycisphaerales bacterium]
MTTIDSTFHAIPRAACDAKDATARRTMLALGLILLVAAGLRFHGLDREGRWGDEYFQTMQYAGSPWQVVLGARTNNQPPLDYLIGWAVTMVARTTWMMRAPAASFGVAGVAMLFVLARRWFGAGAGLLAAGLLAVAPLHWKLSQEARPYTIFVFVMLVTLWLFARAMEKPTAPRVLAYAFVAWLMTLTRGLVPLVVMLCLGVVLSAAWVLDRDNRQRVARVWIATVVVGLLAVPMLLFLLGGDTGWTVFTADDAVSKPSGFAHVFAVLTQNAWIWARAPMSLFGRGAVPILLLAVCGLIALLRGWRTYSLAERCTFAVLGLAGPAYLVVYSVAVAEHPINDRYAMFLTPVVCALAAFGFMRLWQAFGERAGKSLAYVGAGVLVLLPASSTWALSQQCFRPDWRGTADYLAATYDADDVVIVFADRPLGAGQSPYWGKLDWPEDQERPLGESMLTLAISEPHWQRLAQRNGKCCVVLKYFVGEQDADDYRTQGVTTDPADAKLTKFRGLDLLEGFPGTTLRERLIAACNCVIELPKENYDSRAIAYLLRSRVELLDGDVVAARASYHKAVECVPPSRRKWFDGITSTHRDALGQSEPRL